MIRTFLFALFLALSFSPFSAAQAQTMAELRPAFIDGCVEGGNETPICACLYDNWSADVPQDKTPLAQTAIQMFLGKMPDNPQDMMAATELLQGMTSVLLQCASGALEVTAEPANAAIPQTGDAIEEQLLYQRVTTGGTVEEMSRYAALVEARKAREREERLAAQEASDARAEANLVALKAEYEAELAHIHSHDINDWEVGAFHPLFDLYCRSGGGTPESCACAWPILENLSTFNAVPYMASRSEGDDIRQRLSAADSSAAAFSLIEFAKRRESCDP